MTSRNGRRCRTGLSPRVRGNPSPEMLRRKRPGSIPACAGEPLAPKAMTRRIWVYPRVCGGTRNDSHVHLPGGGLSPRVRGNPPSPPALPFSHRSIPACAGEPWAIRLTRRATGVYPRVCGGTSLRRPQSKPPLGLSPRVRGNQLATLLEFWQRRSIPACAGEPVWTRKPPQIRAVYPRVCGGTGNCPRKGIDIGGLSPRVRGNPLGGGLEAGGGWSIPACAGEPSHAFCGGVRLPVYPRVCGGTANREAVNAAAAGLSPRVRGNQRYPPAPAHSRGSIPACAGEPPAKRNDHRPGQVYPRVCGGTAHKAWRSDTIGGLSPRVRGNPEDICDWAERNGSIPACAGEPLWDGLWLRITAVYPRVCGGTQTDPARRTVHPGLSPRVRGNRKV